MSPLLTRLLAQHLPELREERASLQASLAEVEATIIGIEATASPPAPTTPSDDLSDYVDAGRLTPGGKVTFTARHPRPHRLREGTHEVESLYVGSDATSAHRHRGLGTLWQGRTAMHTGCWLTADEYGAVYGPKKARAQARRDAATRATPPALLVPPDHTLVTDADVCRSAATHGLGIADPAGRWLSPEDSVRAHGLARSRR